MCDPDRVETGPDFVPGLSHVAAHSRRYRALGIAGHQPAFAGYAPWALAVRQNDTKVTASSPYPATRGTGGAVDTAWVDGRDALFTRVGDAWMKTIIEDFGTDHVWQMDGFFAGPPSPVLGSWGKTMRDAVRNKERWERRRTPTQDPSTDLADESVSVCAARTLNVNGQSRVTLSLQQEHSRAACGPRQEERGLNTAPKQTHD